MELGWGQGLLALSGGWRSGCAMPHLLPFAEAQTRHRASSQTLA